MKLIAICTVSLLAGVSQLGAATLPYTNNFSGTGANTAFTTESPDAEWAVTGGVYRYSVTSTANIPSTASIPITNAAGAPFTIETQFTVSSAGNVNSAPQTLGFGLFGSDAAFSTTGHSYYLADFDYADSTAGPEGLLRILSLGNTSGFTTTTTGLADNNADGTLAVVLNATYTLRLVATYAGSTLNMTLGLFDAAGTTQIGTSAVVSDTSPLAGTNFGYRNRHSIGGGAVGIDFDNYSIAVPEPTSLAVLGLAGLGVLARRRRPVC